MQTRRTILKSTAAFAFGAVTTLPAFARAPVVGTQAAGFYRLKLGELELTALSDGTIGLPMTDIFQGMPKEEVASYLQGYFQPDSVEFSVNAYLVNTGERLVLIDAGTGTLMGPTLGKLVANIEAAGYRADQIDDVILTHIHPDHSAGLTAEGRRVFENAVLHVNETEARFWLEATPEAQAHEVTGPQILQAHLDIDPYIAAGKFQTFADNADPLPGFGSILRPGHTPGHTTIVVESGGERIEFWGDIAHGDVLQFDRPDVTVSFDVDQPAAMESRAIAFADAADRGYLVAGAHHDFPGIGRIRRDESNYDWVPLTYSASY